jgi:hypothetical protein
MPGSSRGSGATCGRAAAARAEAGWPLFRRCCGWSRPNGHNRRFAASPGDDSEIHPHRSDMSRRGVQHSMSRRLLCLLALAGAFMAIGERSADARQCRIVPPFQAYWESQTVFVGTVRRIAEAEGGRRVTFDVEQIERGASAPTITVRLRRGNSSADHPCKWATGTSSTLPARAKRGLSGRVAAHVSPTRHRRISPTSGR